jgi:hypothetical protein
MKFAYEESDSPATSSMEREIVPTGIHTMEIRHAEEGPNSWKECDQNPTGECLKLRLSVGDYRFIFDDIPQHLGWRAKQLADALGVSADGSQVSLEPDDLIGREIKVEVSHYTSKAGKVSAVVKRYVPAGAASEKPKAKRGPKPAAAVAITTADSDDDIPF